jgi:hypothetical protein
MTESLSSHSNSSCRGFDFVRIPIQWNNYTETSSPYAINESWLDRVEQVIDWSLKHGLITVINSHHDKWILENNSYTSNDLARFDSIWAQVAFRFKDKSDSLIFEIANEPNIAISKTDQINAHIIPIIRKTNPTRLIIFGSSGTQLSTLKKAVIPTDPYLIASFHTYEPWDFAGEGNGKWGTATEIKKVTDMMADAANWSEKHNIPLLFGEFSARSKCEEISRMKWFYIHVNEAIMCNVAPAVWQDFGWFSIYFHTTNEANKWSRAVTDVIVYTHHLSVDSLEAIAVTESQAQLNWHHRASDYKWIRIERKLSNGSYEDIANLDSNVTSYIDNAVVLNKTYTYRIISELSSGEITHSLPVQIKIKEKTAVNDMKSKDNSLEIHAYFVGENLIIKSDEYQPDFFLQVYNLNGQMIKTEEFFTNEFSVNFSTIYNGTYLVRVMNNNGVNTVKKVVKYQLNITLFCKNN